MFVCSIDIYNYTMFEQKKAEKEEEVGKVGDAKQNLFVLLLLPFTLSQAESRGVLGLMSAIINFMLVMFNLATVTHVDLDLSFGYACACALLRHYVYCVRSHVFLL